MNLPGNYVFLANLAPFLWRIDERLDTCNWSWEASDTLIEVICVWDALFASMHVYQNIGLAFDKDSSVRDVL